MMMWLANAAMAFAWVYLVTLAASALLRRPARGASFCGRWAATGFTAAALAAMFAPLVPIWPWVTGDAASGLVGLILWWWSRRRRKRSLRAAGARARARLAAMVKNMPRARALRPVPQA